MNARYNGDSTLPAWAFRVVEQEHVALITEVQALNLLSLVWERRGQVFNLHEIRSGPGRGTLPRLKWSRRQCRLRGKYQPYRHLITLHAGGHNRATLLHEIAHALAPTKAHHGPVFARVYCTLLQEFAGEDPHGGTQQCATSKSPGTGLSPATF